MKKRLLLLLLVLTILLPLSARPKIALVLSGGGARGFMHVPIIQALEERGIYPDMVIGTSMGGLVGGLYAAGYSGDELAAFIMEQNFFSTVFNMTQPVYSSAERAYNFFDKNLITLEYGSEGIGQVNSILSDVKINAMIRQAISKVITIDDFDKLSIPYRTVGTDFKSGEKVVFSSGSLFDAMRSTMSMPIVFPPYILEDDRYIVDGGMVDNFPADLAKEMGADIIIGVDVNENVRQKAESSDSLDTLSGVIVQYMILNTQTSVIKQYDLADYLIIPPTGDISVVGFSDSIGILEAGYRFTRDNAELFDQIAEALKPYLPLDKPSPSYKERGYEKIISFSLPPLIREKYSSLFTPFIAKEYNDEFISSFDELLETIRRRENLKSLTYTVKGNTISVNSEEYLSMQSVLFVGFTGGAFTTFSPVDGFSFGFDPSLSLSTTLNLNSLTIDVGAKVGSNNMVAATVKAPFTKDLFFTSSLYGGYGGYSSVSSRYLVHRYSSSDWNFGTSLGLAYMPSKEHYLETELSLDSYFLSGERRYGSDPVSFYSDNNHVIPSLIFSYQYSSLSPDIITSLSYNNVQLELKVGYEDIFRYSFKGDLSGFKRIKGGSYIDYSASIFTSRYPYELASSYKSNYFGTLSSDSLYADVGYRKNLNSLLYGFYVSGGVFVLADNGTSLPLRESSDGIIIERDISLIPFSSLESIRAGVNLSLGLSSDFGNLELLFRVSSKGEIALALRVK